MFSRGQFAATALVVARTEAEFLNSGLWLADPHFVTTVGAFCFQVLLRSVSRAFVSLAH